MRTPRAPWLAVVTLAFACAPEKPAAQAPPAKAVVANVESDGPAPARWGELRRAARDAARSKDYEAFRARLLDLEAFSHSGRIGYELAAAEALLEHDDAALVRLRAFAAAGLAEDIAQEPAFARLRGTPAFTAIEKAIAQNLTPIAQAKLVFDLPHEDLLTEDIAYDPRSRTFFVSSVHGRKILAIDETGNARPFVVTDAAGAGGVCGLAVHGDRLWATVAALPPAMPGAKAPDPHAKTAVVSFDVRTGGLLQRFELAEEGPHALTDIAVGPNGDVFASDAVGGNVYTLLGGHAPLAVLGKPGRFVSPQTVAPAADGRTVLVPDYVRGIAVVDVPTGAVRWLAHSDDIALNGIDGLYLGASPTQLVAVQNGTTPVRIVALRLDPKATRVDTLRVLERRSPGLGEPTHGVVIDGALHFLANAGWDRFADDGTVRPDAPPDAPHVMRLPPW